MSRLTESQWKAVNKRDTNIIVAASAGTGKTHAMISRVVEIVMGRVAIKDNGIETVTEDKSLRVPVDRILLMTYTKATAAEMKIRLHESLIEELLKVIGNGEEANDKRNYLTEQIDNVPISDISTIHSFCASVLRSYFQEIGINPLFDTADSQDESAFITDAILKTFEQLENDSKLRSLRSIFSIKMNDLRLHEIIVKIYHYAYCQENMEEWLNNISTSQYREDFENTKAMKLFIDGINRQAESIINEMIDTENFARAEGYYEYADWLKNSIGIMSSFVKVNSLNNLIESAGKDRIDTNIKYKTNRELGKRHTKLKHSINNFYEDNNINSRFLNYESITKQIQFAGEMVSNVVHIVKLFSENYQLVKQKENKLTFQDLEQLMVKLLNKDELAIDIADKYDYILIDEYQDINYSQEYIINRISNGNNLFMVGDSKQSIYRFRQAVPEIFIDKESKYSCDDGGFATSFNHNFRSRKAILDYVNSIFKRVMTKEFGNIDYKSVAMLITEPDDDSEYQKANSFPAVSLLTYKSSKEPKAKSNGLYSVLDHKELDEDISNAGREADIIYRAIGRLKDSPYYDRKTDTIRTINHNDIAIIFRNRSNSSNLILNELIKRNLPLNTSTFTRVDKTDEVRLLVNLLRVLDNSRQDIPLVAVMRSYFGKFTDDELANIRLSGKNYNDNIYQILPYIDKREIKEKIDLLFNFINKYRLKSSYLAVYDLVREIIDDTGYDRYLLAHPEGELMYKGIMSFLYSIKGKSFSSSISRFLYYYDNYVTDITKPNSSESGTDSITVSTMHGVKGLEYPVVIIANSHCNLSNSSKDKYIMDNEMGLCFQNYDLELREQGTNIVYDVLNKIKSYKEKEDNLNLFYVALTRAKNHLIITGKENKDSLKVLENGCDATSFLDWAAVGVNNSDYKCLEDEELLGDNESDMVISDNKDIRQIAFFRDKVNPIYYETIKNMLKDDYKYKESTNTGIKYSVSAINKSAEVDDIFVPSLFSEDTTFLGTVNHKVMEYIDFKCNSITDIEDEIKRLLELKILTEQETEEVHREEIFNCIQSEAIQYAKNNKVLREQTFMLKIKANELLNGVTSEDEVLLQGTIDLIVLGEKNVIVDYKRTGIKDDNKIIERYKTQLELYKKAVERILNIKIDECIIYIFGQDRQIVID